jgi:predicted RNA-binding protein YlqC (UPF0109 family)
MKPTTTTTQNPDVAKLTKLLRELVAAFTRHHAELKVDGAKMGSGIQLSLQAHRDDHPRIVGSCGTHIRAIQNLFGFMGRRLGIQVRVTLLEPNRGEKWPLEPYVENTEWRVGPMLNILTNVCGAVFGEGATCEPADIGEMTVIEVRPGAGWCALMDDTRTPLALHLLFHAIGKAQGRIVHVHVIDPTGKVHAPDPGTRNGASV